MDNYNFRKRVNKNNVEERKKTKGDEELKRCVICGDKLKSNNEKQLCGQDVCRNELKTNLDDKILDEKKQIQIMKETVLQDEVIDESEELEDSEEDIDYDDIIDTDVKRYEKILRKLCEINLDGNHLVEMERFLKDHLSREIKLVDIMGSDMPQEMKTAMVESWLIMKNTDNWTEDYRTLRNTLKAQLWQYDEKIGGNEAKLLENLKKKSLSRVVTVDMILKSTLPEELKLEVMERYNVMLTWDPYSAEYMLISGEIKKRLETWKPEYNQTYKQLHAENTKSYEELLFSSPLPPKAKSHIFKELKHFHNMKSDDGDYSKQKYWLDFALSLPTKVKEFPIKKGDGVEKKKEFEKYVKERLDKSCYGMDNVKDMLLDYVFQCVSNPHYAPPILVLCGPPGVGKTTLAKSLAHSIGRDFLSINLAGAHDVTKLVGHNKTYVGAIPGELVRGLAKCSHTNPVIYIDELDKVSNKDVQSVLTHILDPSQNMEFIDEYLGFPIDLSKTLTIITVNNKENIDKILADRLFIVEVSGYTKKEKLGLVKGSLLPKIYDNMGCTMVQFTDKAIEHLIEIVPEEKGVRTLQKHLQFIVQRCNRIMMLTGKEVQVTEQMVNEVLEKWPRDKEVELTMYM